MNKSILENAIIINGEVFELVEDHSKVKCDHCSLKEKCFYGDENICLNVHYKEDAHRYQKVGTLEEVLAKNEKRKVARHHIATLIRRLRWQCDAVDSKYKPVSVDEYIKAMNFAIQELKEKYK